MVQADVRTKWRVRMNLRCLYHGGTERRCVWLEQSEQGRHWWKMSLARSSGSISGITLWENSLSAYGLCVLVFILLTVGGGHLHLLLSKCILYGSIVDLLCCDHLCYMAQWQLYTYIHSFKNIIFHYGLSQEIGYSSLCYTDGPCCLSILNERVWIY